MSLRKEIKDIVGPMVEDLIDDILAAVAERVQDIAKNSPTKAKPKAKTAPKSEEDMRCRFSDKSRHRCTARSRGPRFKFMCEAHAESAKKPAAKLVEVAPVEQALQN